MSGQLAILVPVLKRPHRVVPLLESIEAATPDAEVLFVSDPEDPAERAAIEAARAGTSLHVLSVIRRGNYAHKINEAATVTQRPLLFLGADDLHFHPGWFEAAAALLTETVGVVGTNDLCNRRVMRGDHSTHSLVARWYAALGTIDNPRQLLHDGYPHEFVDDEFVETAKHRRAYKHCHAAIVEHLHPMVGKAPMDELYDGMAYRMRRGRRIFRRRQPLWT